MKLYLGCGRSRRNSFTGVDLVPGDCVDVVHDLSQFPYPFENDSVTEVLMRNILEHLPDTIKVMEEIWRICTNNAKIQILVPYFNSPGASQDPTHMRFFTENSFDYFTPDNFTDLSYYNYYSKARFSIISVKPEQRALFSFFPRKMQYFLAHHFATVHSIEFNLSAIK